MRIHIVCGTNDGNEPETFDVFTNYEDAVSFRLEKNSKRKPHGIFYDLWEGEFHNEKKS